MDRTLEPQIWSKAQSQLGLITRAQASAQGMPRHQIDQRVKVGTWQCLHRCVYALPGSPPSWERKVLAATLAAGPGALGSHLTAMMVHRLDGASRSRIEISVPDTTTRRLRDVVVHRSLVIASHDRATLAGIPVTSVARTLADCSGRLSIGQLARALDDALVRGLAARAEIDEVANRLGPAPGRRISRLRMLLAERGAEADTAGSRPEMRIVRVLRAAGLPDPVSQHPVWTEGRKFFIDVAYPDCGLALEYQGFDPHRSRSAFDSDAKRTRLLTAAGWKVLYFTSRDSDADIVSAIRTFVG